MKNMQIRLRLFETGMKYYELARLMGIDSSTLSRRLRTELSAEDQESILALINKEVERRHDSN